VFDAPAEVVIYLTLGVLAFSVLGLLAALASKAARDTREFWSRQRFVNYRQILTDPSTISDRQIRSWIRNGGYRRASLLRAIQTIEEGQGAPVAWVPRQRDLFAAGLLRAVGSRSAARRGLALTVLGYLRRPADCEIICGMATDKDGDVSLCAIRALGRLATLQAFEALLSLLGQEDDAHLTPLSQARIVERISEPWAQPYLRPALAATAAASGERPAGVQVLGPESHEQNPGHNVGDRQALGLMRALAVSGVSVPIGELEPWLRHGSIDERIAAIRASAACCGEVSAPMLAAVEDDSAVVRAQAVRAIGQVTVPPALLQATLDVLTAQATDRNWWVRGYAMSSLATLGAPGLAVLRATAESDDRFAAQRASEQLAITETEARR